MKKPPKTASEHDHQRPLPIPLAGEMFTRSERDALDALTLTDQISAVFQRFREENEQTLARLEQLVSRLALAAASDDLTGTLRRGPGLAAIQRELERAERTGDPLVIAVVDLDN